MSSPSSGAPIGILGGTFDPIHFAHLRLALEAREQLGLDHVRFIPSARPPHRDTPQTSPEHRLAMVQLAIADQSGFVADPIELHRTQQSYTIDTLTSLRAQFGPDRSLCLLMGADAFVLLETWKRWRNLFDYAHIAVAHRPGFPPQDWPQKMGEDLREAFDVRQTNDASTIALKAHGSVFPIAITQMDISASRVRTMFAQHQSPRYLIPESVLGYIERNQLYR